MKVYWFSFLSVIVSAASIVLLAGTLFGSEVRWSDPKSASRNGEKTETPSACRQLSGFDFMSMGIEHIPAYIMLDDDQAGHSMPFITQVQHLAPNPFADSLFEEDLEGRDVRLIPALPRTAPVLIKTDEAVPCGDMVLFKSIRDISHDIRHKPDDVLPAECVVDVKPFYGRHFGRSNYYWTASALSTQGAYFEDTQLERHGHTKVRPAFQPLVSGTRFFSTVALLPYHMGVTPPSECVYTLGHQRVGTYTPYMSEPFPISPRGTLFQAGAITGGIFAFP